MAQRQDLQGQKFGRLTVQSSHDRQNSHLRWLCVCDCGNTHIAKGIHLKRGLIQSCGCYNLERIIARNTTHSLSRVDGKWTPEYATWRNIKERCGNPNNHGYLKYGARGIHLCAEWLDDYLAFYQHIGPRPSAQYSIDRIDNNRGYEPGNVRWATIAQQSYNKRSTVRFIDVNEARLTIGDIAQYLAVAPQFVREKLSRFWRA